jgi:MFS family permease
MSTASGDERASAWLMKVQPVTTEERAFQLFGLGWAGVKANNEVIKKDHQGRTMALAERGASAPGAFSGYKIWQVILAAAVGTMIEFYDFFIFGSLTAVLASKFYPPGNTTFAYLAYLATFAIGFVFRPFGALFFGRIGDLVGRKYTFLVTLVIMGGGTTAIGLLPTYATAGWFAPIALIALRALQGMAIGGEFGGAAVYVAEHAPDHKRGFYTSFIQMAGPLGNLVSLAVILIVQNSLSQESFNNWGWRIPFLLSILLVAISLYIRMRMKESPIFSELKSAGMTSAKPLKEAFTKWSNLKLVLISLFGATAGMGVIALTANNYALFYLQTILRVNAQSANTIVAVAYLIGTPSLIIFGPLSDRIGRKKLMMAGCLLAMIGYFPIYKAMESAVGNHVVTAQSRKDPVTGAIALTPLTQDASGALVQVSEAPAPNLPMLIFLVFVQLIFATMVAAPLTAYLVEAFPAKIRYTSFSLPYHIGNGVFGGLQPLIGLSAIAATGDIYAGLWYPVIVAGITFIVGTLLLRETRQIKIWDELSETRRLEATR